MGTRSKARQVTLLLAAAMLLLPATPASAGFTLVGTFGGLPDLSESGAAGRLDYPFRADATSDGTVYVVDRMNERISKFSAAGVFERAWGKNVSPSGGTGAEICTTICQKGSQGTLKGEISFAWGIAVSPDGNNVYVADYFNRRIHQFTSMGAFVRLWGWDVNTTVAGSGFEICEAADTCKTGTTGTGAGQFDRPVGIAVAPSGDVYVTDRDNHRVQQFSAVGAFIRGWGWDVDPGGGTGFEICTATCQKGAPGNGDGQFTNSSDVAVDSTGVVTVISENNSAQRFSADGAFLSRFGSLGSGPGQLNNPWAMDVSASGELFISQIFQPSAVHRFTATGAFLETFDESGSILDSPTDIVPADPGFAYIVKSSSNRVDRYAVSDVLTPPTPTPTPTPTPEPTPTPAPTPKPAPTPASLPPASQVISLPSARKCVSRRNFKIRLRKPAGVTIREALVILDGKKVDTIRGKRLGAPVDLRGKPKGRFTVKITIVLSDGRKLSGSRRYKTCAPKKR